MELFAADGHDAGGCERVTGKSGMRPQGCSLCCRAENGWRLGEYDQAQAFTTGADVAGYTLSSVAIVLFSASDTAFPGTVSIRTERNNRPGDSLGTLTNPDTLTPLGECTVLPCPEDTSPFKVHVTRTSEAPPQTNKHVG